LNLKLYLKRWRCSRSIVGFFVMLVLTACGDSGPKSTTGAYGESANYIEYASINYPAFSLRFIEKRGPESNAPEVTATYLFQIADGTTTQQIEWHDASYRMGSYEPFLYKGQKFVLDLKYSDFLDKKLPDGELVIWTQPQYEQFKHNKSQVWDDKIRKLSEPAVKFNQQQQRKKTAAPLFEIYKEYRQALDMSELDNVASFLSEENPQDLVKQVDTLYSHHNPGLHTLNLHDAAITDKSAKLHLSATSVKDDYLIGVIFIRHKGQWKIADEKVMPDNADGKEWIKRFM